MSQVKADIEALRKLREALIIFIDNQKEALDKAKREIAITVSMLEEAERHWYFQVRQREEYLERCHEEAIAAAFMGYEIDCSSYADTLQEAEENLFHIRQLQQQVEETIIDYRQKEEKLDYLLESDMWQAANFLKDRIKALESYYSIQPNDSSEEH
jgi:hypothetical protein